MNTKQSFGEYLRKLREEHSLPIRKVASKLDIDPSTLGKIERGERSANKEMIPILATLFKIEEKTLGLILFSDKVAYQIIGEENTNEILKVAEEKIEYLKNLNLKQGKINFEN
ncbi:helix-turn-helix transcriptional regulator [uncultured Maribacter sp.]|jgi:transcriptional regulator with XRE-family HTH domain|uniref:helix-turn-helix domain-containing protein n=1 Tax=uncultured Maribacter sp. TaxID=431308 RepID=UPI0026284699|nr:helix-turn-helix transcriptional regulator [uncultured Maribacter sp.]